VVGRTSGRLPFVCGLCPCGCTIKSNQRGVVETVCNGISKPTDQVLSMLDQQPCETQKDSTRDIRMTFLSLLSNKMGHRNVDVSASGTQAHFWPLMSTVLKAACLPLSKIMPALPVAKRTRPSSFRSIRCSPPWSQMNCMQLRDPASGSSSSPWKASHSTTESRLISGLYLYNGG
jgi:hypothetical protein